MQQKLKPLKPTLRVETSYCSEALQKIEEKRIEKALRMPLIKKPPLQLWREHKGFLANEPYAPFNQK
jgi:hypothetical protein